MSGFLGIDLGTSSVKLLFRSRDGNILRAREAYTEKTPQGWWAALCRGIGKLPPLEIEGVGLSSQVGTYLVNGGESIIGWDAAAGVEELNKIKGDISQEIFLSEISMPHPDLLSYPMPAILYAKKRMEKIHSICMPKDFLMEKLTGHRLSDPYSWRGLANLETEKYSEKMLDYLNVSADILPPLLPPSALAGRLTREAALETGLREGLPIYNGCNDFFAALLGSGVQRNGDLFDITGTSEHVGGVAEENLRADQVVSGKYFFHFVRYGVTASSGPSLDLMRRLFPGGCNPKQILEKIPPVFLPYLNGERCPICDPNARGVFFGVSGNCGEAEMAYAVMEGVCFSLKHILEKLQLPRGPMIVTGGAAENPALNQLKADILGMELTISREKEASALGACMIAMTGAGECAGFEEAQKICCGEAEYYSPENTDAFTDRFALYKRLYPILKDEFQALRSVKKQ